MPIPKKVYSAPKSAKQMIYESLRDWIIDGTLAPGEKILDSEVAEHFSVSRTPVREAMQVLADQKLISINPGRESRVTNIGDVDIIQVYRLLANLHSLAVDFSYSKIDKDTILHLKEINRQLSNVIQAKDNAMSRASDTAFHNVFLNLADNDFLSRFTSTLSAHVARVENVYFGNISDTKDSVKEHMKIIEMLEQHDLAGTRAAMEYNWLHTVEIYKQVQKESTENRKRSVLAECTNLLS